MKMYKVYRYIDNIDLMYEIVKLFIVQKYVKILVNRYYKYIKSCMGF